MSDEYEFDPREFLNNLRKSASVKTGAIMFGEAQVAYYDTLKQHMSDEDAYNLLAHTTEVLLRAIAEAIGPVTAALLQANYMWERLGRPMPTDKEVPGGGS